MAYAFKIAFFIFSISPLIAQESKLVFIVDGVPVLKDAPVSLNNFPHAAIANITSISNKSRLHAFGYKHTDTLYVITTIAYQNRPQSIKNTPSTASMDIIAGLYHLKNKSTPYSGKYINYYWDGHIKSEGLLLEGRQHGTQITYTKQQGLASEIKYQNGLRNGYTRIYYDDGKLQSVGRYKNSRPTGTWYHYYPNRQIKSVVSYNNKGKKQGQEIIFIASGFIASLNNYQNGKKTSKDHNALHYITHDNIPEHLEKSQLKKLIKLYNKALDLDAAWAAGYYNRGLALLLSDHAEKAISDFNKAMALNLDFAPAYYGRALSGVLSYQDSKKREINSLVELYAYSSQPLTHDQKQQVYHDLKTAGHLGYRSTQLYALLRAYKPE